MSEIIISTRRPIELVDITKRVQSIITKHIDSNGTCNIFIPHATAGLLINENEEGLIKDFEKVLKNQYQDMDFQHNRIDNNASSHILSGLIGVSTTIPFENKKLKLGSWQQIFFVELDGPRSQRKILINLIGEKN